MSGRSWLAGLTAADLRAAARLRVGLAAASLGDTAVARQLADELAGPGSYQPGQQFRGDLAPILAHLIGALDAGDGRSAVAPALFSALSNYSSLERTGQLNEPTL